MQLSIIMPAFNEEKTIVKVLHSLFREVPDICEIIVVDDGSTDQTAQLAESMAKQYPQIKGAGDDPRDNGHDSQHQAGDTQSLSGIATLFFHSVRYYTKYRNFAPDTKEKGGKVLQFCS